MAEARDRCRLAAHDKMFTHIFANDSSIMRLGVLAGAPSYLVRRAVVPIGE
jgi:hypothetical protein